MSDLKFENLLNPDNYFKIQIAIKIFTYDYFKQEIKEYNNLIQLNVTPILPFYNTSISFYYLFEKWKNETQSKNIYDFFYDLRRHYEARKENEDLSKDVFNDLKKELSYAEIEFSTSNYYFWLVFLFSIITKKKTLEIYYFHSKLLII